MNDDVENVLQVLARACQWWDDRRPEWVSLFATDGSLHETVMDGSVVELDGHDALRARLESVKTESRRQKNLLVNITVTVDGSCARAEGDRITIGGAVGDLSVTDAGRIHYELVEETGWKIRRASFSSVGTGLVAAGTQ